jgi:type IV secretion system protein VirB8
MALEVKKKSDLDKYFSDAKGWDFDRVREANKQKRIAYLVAGAGVTFGLAMLGWHVAMPLRSVEPYVMRVDRQTGGIDVITRLTNTRDVTADEMVNKFFISEYVRNREAWNAAASREMENRVYALSVPQEQEKFSGTRRVQNPNSPANTYQSGEVVSASVRNITFINNRVAQVRFRRSVMRPGNAPEEASNWIATINFKYVDRPTTERGRLENPLGFQVVSYRADPEIAS